MTQIRLHLGCGKRYIPGFIHIDRADFPHIDYRRDVGDLSVFGDETVDLIYASHVLEYFDRLEVRDVLREWRRVLKRGAVLRVAVPDFEALIEAYRRYGLKSVLGPLYGRMESGGGVIYHRTVYDFDGLKEVLEENGFGGVRRYDWRQTIHRDYDDYSQSYLPHMDKEKGMLISLNVEAHKV